MTYHQTLNNTITLGRRPTSGNTRRTFKGATGTAKQGENKDIGKTLHRSCFPERQIPWERETGGLTPYPEKTKTARDTGTPTLL